MEKDIIIYVGLLLNFFGSTSYVEIVIFIWENISQFYWFFRANDCPPSYFVLILFFSLQATTLDILSLFFSILILSVS